MLEVGIGSMTFVEWRSHFAAWCIVSSPLVLGLDMTNDTLVDSVWPIVANPEALAVSQTYYGFSGTVYAASNVTVNLCTGDAAAEAALADGKITAAGCSFPSWQALYKPISATSTAVLLMNHDSSEQDLTVTFSQVPGLPCAGGICNIRDIHARANIGSHTGSFTFPGVASHDSVFVLLSTP